MKKSSNMLFTIIGALVLICSVVIISYAWLTRTFFSSSTNIIKAEQLKISLEEANDFSMVNAFPQDENEALENNDEYTFSLSNNGVSSVYYKINLTSTCSTNCLPLQYIDVALAKNDNNYIINKNWVNNNLILDLGSINPSAENNYRMKIWIDVNTPDNYQGTYKFNAKLTLFAGQNSFS